MQTRRKQLNRIVASWALAGVWFLALVGMSVVSSPYTMSHGESFALEAGTTSIAALATDPMDQETL